MLAMTGDLSGAFWLNYGLVLLTLIPGFLGLLVIDRRRPEWRVPAVIGSVPLAIVLLGGLAISVGWWPILLVAVALATLLVLWWRGRGVALPVACLALAIPTGFFTVGWWLFTEDAIATAFLAVLFGALVVAGIFGAHGRPAAARASAPAQRAGFTSG